MRALVLVVLLLAGCATQHPADAFAGINTREDFMLRTAGFGGPADKSKPAVRECAVREWEKITPAPVLAAMDRFLANKTQANWEAFLAADRAHPIKYPAEAVDAIYYQCRTAT